MGGDRLRRGVLLETGGRPDEAAAEYAACLELPPAHLAQNVTVRPRLGRCRLAAAAGDLAGALDHAARALDHVPRREPRAVDTADPSVSLVNRWVMCSLEYAARSRAGPAGADKRREAMLANGNRQLHGLWRTALRLPLGD